MYWTYLRRELAGRTRQTAIVAAGLAIAIALVIVVTSLSAGVRDAQAHALASVYGVGTDLTVSGAQSAPGEGGRGGPSFEFGGGEGESGDGTTALRQSRLMTDMMRGTLEGSTVESLAGLDGVSAVTGALSLENTTFSGEIPTPDDATGGEGATMQPPTADEGRGGQGGPDGLGGSSFDIESFRVLGVDPAVSAVGPLSGVEASSGRLLDADDAGTDVVVVDATYAASHEIAVGDALDVGGTSMEVVGIAASTTADADTAADVYLPLDVAQELAGVGDVVSTVYVQATSSDAIATLQSAIAQALPEATVSSQADLAADVSGSLSNASALISDLGTWLAIVVLAVALVISVLLTLSGVSRRTREFGTLKAIGWSDRRIVGQVAGESLVQGLIGGAAGLVLGLGTILVITLVGPTVTASTASGGTGGPGGGPGGLPGGGFADALAASSDVVLGAPITAPVILAAVGLAIGGGLLAGAFGGWRAARLSPAEALRSAA